jgi:hypothetical protein
VRRAVEKGVTEERASLGLGDPSLYVIVETEENAGRFRSSPAFLTVDEPVRLVHVISPSAGGEVRGYWLARGTLYLRHPAHPLAWPEVDAAVSKVLGGAPVAVKVCCRCLGPIHRAVLASTEPERCAKCAGSEVAS